MTTSYRYDDSSELSGCPADRTERSAALCVEPAAAGVPRPCGTPRRAAAEQFPVLGAIGAVPSDALAHRQLAQRPAIFRIEASLLRAQARRHVHRGHRAVRTDACFNG